MKTVLSALVLLPISLLVSTTTSKEIRISSERDYSVADLLRHGAVRQPKQQQPQAQQQAQQSPASTPAHSQPGNTAAYAPPPERKKKPLLITDKDGNVIDLSGMNKGGAAKKTPTAAESVKQQQEKAEDVFSKHLTSKR